MKPLASSAVIVVLLASVVAGSSLRDVSLDRLATCQDRWIDWKENPVQMQAFSTALQSGFAHEPGKPFSTPKTSTTVLGLPLVRLYPQSVGMAVGFSVEVTATFDAARKAVEKAAGRALSKCETGDGMRACELELGEKRTLMLMADASGKSTTTMFGCYYLYEK